MGSGSRAAAGARGSAGGPGGSGIGTGTAGFCPGSWALAAAWKLAEHRRNATTPHETRRQTLDIPPSLLISVEDRSPSTGVDEGEFTRADTLHQSKSVEG